MIDGNGRVAFIRAAVETDVDRIYEIAAEQAAKVDPSSNAIESSGLVSRYGRETYQRSIRTASYFLVLVQDGTITSFMLAFDSRDSAPEEIKLDMSRSFIERDTRRVVDADGRTSFIVVKQICTAKRFTRRGHARLLYQALKNLRRNASVYAAIVLSPPNVPSIRLHEELGFIRTFEFKDEDDGFKRAFWRCSRIEEKDHRDLLIHQHSVAADLYRHEDDLNWKKLSALFYISVALLTGIGVLLVEPQGGFHAAENWTSSVAFCLGLLGFMISLFFSAALRSGVRYMLHRKQTLIDIDAEIAKLNGIRMLVPVRISPTAKYLKWISVGAPMVWIILDVSIVLFF